MQLFSQTLLAVLLAHLLADFPLQTDSLVRAKTGGIKGFLTHGAIHFATVNVALLLFTHNTLWSLYTQAILVAYVVLHIALDYMKQLYLRVRGVPDSTWPFVVDQALHFLMAVAVTWALTRVSWGEVRAAAFLTDRLKQNVLLVAVTYAAVIFAGGYLVRSMTRSLTEEMTAPAGEDKDALRNAGLYIGWLERFLVLTALLVQSPAMIGLILTGKSIARLGELKGPKFAEYFLIGTLLSLSLAISGGIFLMLMFYGTVFPK
jgi:Protein of unknown function (DUF3307)